jgi:Flp pilus assembly pilin Flp
MLAKLKQLRVALSLRVLQRDRRGQDMIEYALLAAAIVVIVAGILPTQLMPMVSTIFSKIVGTFAKAPS